MAIALLCAASPRAGFATSAEPSTDPQLDPAPCIAAAAADDADKAVSICGALIDNAKTTKPDRIKALVARAGAYDRKDMIDSAIADYDAALRLDPAQADVFNLRGELWRRKGDRRRALADFAAAIRLNPDHPAAKANHKSLAQELDRLGALMAVARQAELQLRDRQASGREGDLRQSRACQSRPRDQCREYPGGA